MNVMDKENTPANAFYDSDEDFAWGPITLNEIKRDLKTKKKLDSSYRRQTLAFCPSPLVDNNKMNTTNSTQSSKDYQTANESIESSLRTTLKPENDLENALPINSNESNFIQCSSDIEKSEVVLILSDSEDESETPESITVKKERISSEQKKKYNEINDEDVICLSSSDEEAETSDRDGNASYVCTPIDGNNQSINESHNKSNGSIGCDFNLLESFSDEDKSFMMRDGEEPKQIPIIRIIAVTPVAPKNNLNQSGSYQKSFSCDTGHRQNSNNGSSFTRRNLFEESLNRDKSQQNSSFCNKSSNHTLNESNEGYVSTSESEVVEIPQKGLRSPIEKVNYSKSANDKVNSFERSGAEAMLSFGGCENQEIDEISHNEDTPPFDRYSDRIMNISQTENAYDYCEEKNETVSKSSDYFSPKSIQSDLSHVKQENEENELKSMLKEQNGSNSIYHESLENVQEDLENCSLNDTFSEMQKLIYQGYDSNSDDSCEDLIESTPNKPARINKSRIPTLANVGIDSTNSSSIKSDFKVPKPLSKVLKKTPASNKVGMLKTSPSPLKNIVSPVRLYIENSPFPVINRNHRPECSKTKLMLGDNVEEQPFLQPRHRNIMDSLPEVVYKPSKLVREKVENQFIVPQNIKKILIDTTVIKHEARQRIDPDYSVAIGDKLAVQYLSRVVHDEHNLSVHTIKQGFKL